ncbi:hypothetical protein SDC9_169589 [bioreactor metagenome]|uniref:Uncharacterized protein n=1 Tax=bioreactor metagenome TaxID=1076179 RepID=A0A645G7U4_9ZZZZ
MVCANQKFHLMVMDTFGIFIQELLHSFTAVFHSFVKGRNGHHIFCLFRQKTVAAFQDILRQQILCTGVVSFQKHLFPLVEKLLGLMVVNCSLSHCEVCYNGKK